MTLLPAGVKVHLAFGYTDMRKGIDGLALLVQEVLQQDPFSGHLFVFRGRKAKPWDRKADRQALTKYDVRSCNGMPSSCLSTFSSWRRMLPDARRYVIGARILVTRSYDG
jgi:hypothetical protein